jgi:hypothetical protein
MVFLEIIAAAAGAAFLWGCVTLIAYSTLREEEQE